MTRSAIVLSLAVLLLALVVPAQAMKMYVAIDYTLYDIDPTSGLVTNPRPIMLDGVPTMITALDFGPGGVLYGTVSFEDPGPNINHLVTITPWSGVATDLGLIDYGTNTPAISFDPTGQLWGIARHTPVEDQLMMLGLDAHGVPVGDIQERGVLGMEYVGGYLLGVHSTTDNFIRIDPATGVRTVIGPTGVDFTRGSCDWSYGVMYSVMQHENGSLEPTLFTIDIATGQATKVGELGLGVIPGASIGLAAIPEPGLLTLAIPVLALLGLRRRK
jgi:hypothetical protein